jgi:hypothetical protein
MAAGCLTIPRSIGLVITQVSRRPSVIDRSDAADQFETAVCAHGSAQSAWKKAMTLGSEGKRLGSAYWDRPDPGLVWRFFLERAPLDGRGLRTWQRWIRWSRPRSAREQVRDLAAGCMAWLTMPLDAWRAVRKYGAKAKALEGVPTPAQFLHLLRWLAAGGRPVAYYKFQLFRKDRWPRATDFVDDAGIPLQVLSRRLENTGDAGVLMSKDDFDQWAREQGIAAPQTLWVVHPDGSRQSSVPRLPACDLFVKPTDLRSGMGTAWYDFVGSPAAPLWQERGASPLDPPSLEKRLAEVARQHGRPFVVQVALRNHSGLMGATNGALATVRLMTYREPGAAAKPLLAALRMPVGSAIADNFDLGGLAAPISLRSGVCGPALYKRGDYPLETVDRHPDTGAMVNGMEVPHWQQCLELGCSSHDLLQIQVPVVGWDIAVLANGPIIVEANYLPDGNLAQMPSGIGLGATPYAPVLVLALRRHFLGAKTSAGQSRQQPASSSGRSTAP